jgi:thiol-disulfide isomerase/thioredoxin
MMKLIKFYAEWCGPCKSASQMLDKLHISIPVESVDIDADYDTAMKRGIRSIPTLLLVDENDVSLRRLNTPITEQKLTEFLGEYVVK